MKITKRELVIIIPLAAFGIFIIFGTLTQMQTSTTPDQEIIPTESFCQQGWYKYELESGILCSKTELSASQLEEYLG